MVASPASTSTVKTQTLSVIVLTYNEAHRLRPCLESARWADEIVVVDGGSTDDSTAIAREYTAAVYVSDLLGPHNPGGFAAQRNFALDKATGDWVFFLDADERVTPELRAEIETRLLGSHDEAHTAYRVPRKEHFFGVYSPYTHGLALQTRLLKRGAGRFNERLVHESMVYEGTCGDLNGFLLHFSKDTVAEYVSTMNRYTTLEVAELMKTNTPLARSPWSGMIRAFLYRYIKMQSYREGAFGLLMSLMFAQYQFLMWAKHWEMCKNEGRIPGETHAAPFTAAVCGLFHNVWEGLGGIKRRLRRTAR